MSTIYLHIFVTVTTVLSLPTDESTVFEMEGSQTSFAKFPSWQPCENGSLSFEFKTKQKHAMLLYADDGGLFDFIEVKLVSGMARLRLNFGSGTIVITSEGGLNNQLWHKVEIVRNFQETKFIVDKIVHSKNLNGPDFTFGNHSHNSYLFIGGLPIRYIGLLRLLALPSIMFEPRFRGFIRNLMLSQCGGPLQRVKMKDYDGVRNTEADYCARGNPCQNNGLCISTDTGFFCDCQHTGFRGDICEIGKCVLINGPCITMDKAFS